MAYGIQDLSDDGNLNRLGNNLVEGISNGAILALIALGYTLVYGIIELINFAHGEVFMLGSLTAAALYSPFGLTPNTSTAGLVLGLLAILIISMLASGIAQRDDRAGRLPAAEHRAQAGPADHGGRHVVHPAERRHPLDRRVPGGLPDLLGSQKHLFEVWGITVTRGHVLAIAVTIPLVILLTSFVGRSRLGKAMRATAQDPEAARLMGINVDTTISLTFLLGGLMAGAAGLISALYQTSIWYFQGFSAGLYAFTAAVMGGIGNIRGAVLGGLIIGIIQGISDNRIGNDWTPAIVFVYLVIIMVFRPQGLIGEETREAG